METTVPKAKYVLYARKSSEAEERQALSVDSQVKEMLQIAERDSLEVIDIRRESHSAKESGQRPVFKEIIGDIQTGRYSGILVWHPDRLSRNAGDLGSLVDLMDRKLLLEIRTYGQKFTNTPSDKFLLMILCSQAKLENDNKSVNVKRGLRTRCEMGLWPAPAPTGYLNEKRIDRKGYVAVDPERGPVIKKMFEKIAYDKWSGRKIYHWLKFDLNFRSATSNKPLTLSNIYRLLQTPFFYGSFEYPAKSGKWYTGRHEPLITRELFDKVKEQLKRSEIVHEDKQFAFSRLITCGLCGSGVCAEDKYKKLAKGGVAHYVYYGCNRSKDIRCKNKYIREEELIHEIIGQVGSIKMNMNTIRKNFEVESERLSKFRKQFLGERNSENHRVEFDVIRYVTYILTDGSITEKRDFMASIETKFILKNKKLSTSSSCVPSSDTTLGS